MDILAHSIASAVCCSRSGLAGGLAGFPGQKWFRDATVWWAVFFGLLPDMLSMWLPFVLHFVSGADGNFFVCYGGNWLLLYRWVHSLWVALACVLATGILRGSLSMAALAWPLHILCDAATHGPGRFQTMMFYPLSDWGFNGLPFWRDYRVMLSTWVLPLMACLLVMITRRLARGRIHA